MERKMHVSLKLLFGAFLLLILFSSPPCSAGDGVPGIRGMLPPVTGSLAKMPMDISFNGSSGPLDAKSFPGLARDRQALLPGSKDPVKEMLRTDCRPFARVQSYMLKYVNIGTPMSTEKVFDSTASPRIEGRPSEKISLEVQAGLADLSGALFIVLQI